MSRRKQQQPKPKPPISEMYITGNYLEDVISQMERSHPRRNILWFPTDEPFLRLFVALRQEVPLGMSAAAAGKGQESPTHPQNSNRYFSTREEAQQLVDVLRGQLSEVGIGPAYGTGLTCVSAKCTVDCANRQGYRGSRMTTRRKGFRSKALRP